MNERNLLEKLIKEKLGKGKAEFEMRVGGKSIDLVFEKEDEIWIIEAKKALNFEALGQVLTYEELYKQQFLPCKNINLAIVYEEGDPDIEQACQSKGVKVFISKETEGLPKKVGEAPICGICGSEMVEEEKKYKCKTCEYFFGMSSIIKKCSCGRKFGFISKVTQDVLQLLRIPVYFEKTLLSGFCPECIANEKVPANYEKWEMITIASLIKEELNQGNVTPFHLKRIGALPDEFIDYCLGKTKPYF